MKKDFATARQYYTINARQMQVPGVADTVAVGYVREQTGRVSYVVFYGKQSKPAKYFSAKDAAQAEQRVTEALTAAGQVAGRKAEARKQPRWAFHDSESNGILLRSYTTAGIAQLIREALKASFPGVKFSVTSSTYAGGSSVDIEYCDGPSEQQVKQVYARFISGHFDGSKDRYVYHQEPTVIDASGQLRRESYGAKYLSTRRNYSAAYGFFLNSLDLRERPTLARQFAAFYAWHSRQRYYMQASYGHHAGSWTLSSDSSHGDLEQLAAALSAQGYAPQLTQAADVLTLTITGADDHQPEPAGQPSPQAITAAATVPQASDQTDREFAAAERSWLRDPGQDSTDREFEAAERSWLAW